MNSTSSSTVYSKTAKGVALVSSRNIDLPRELGLVFLSVDGQTSIADLLPVSGMTERELDEALIKLIADGYIEIAQPRASEAAAVFQPHNATPAARVEPARRESPFAPLHTDTAPAPARAAFDEAAIPPRVEADVDDLADSLKAKAEAERLAREGDQRTVARSYPGADAQPGWAQSDPPPELEIPEIDEPPLRRQLDEERVVPAESRASPLQRAIGQSGASAQALEQRTSAPDESASSRSAGERAPETHSIIVSSASGNQRLNVDRAAHDVLAAQAQRGSNAAAVGRTAFGTIINAADEDARRKARALRAKKRAKLAAFAMGSVAVALVAGVVYLQFVPLEGYRLDAQRALSSRLNQPATVSQVRYVLLPTPRFVLDGVSIGAERTIQVHRVDAPLGPHRLSSTPLSFGTIEARGVLVQPAVLRTIGAWNGGRSAQDLRLERLLLRDVKLVGGESELEPLEGDFRFARSGVMTQGVLGNERLKLELTPAANAVRLVFSATNTHVPFAPHVRFAFLGIEGVADAQQFTSTNVSGNIGGGTLAATLKARWTDTLRITGDFSLRSARMQDLMPLITSDFSARGILNVSGRYALEGNTSDALFSKPTIDATFSANRGELEKIDVIRATQSVGKALSGGRTAFEELTGSFQLVGGVCTFRQLQLASVPLNAQASFAVMPDGRLSGRLNAAVIAPGGAATRAALTLSGTVKEPQVSY